MKLVMNAFKSLGLPLVPNPFTSVIAAALMIAITIALEKALDALFTLIGFEQGGFPIYGQPFIAREAGPELVGTMNGRNAVVNNDQIVEAVSTGVFQAWNAAWRDNSSNAPAIARVFLDGKEIARSTSV